MTSPFDPQVDGASGAELSDLIAEAVVWTDRPAERAEALLQIVHSAVDAICWRIAAEDRSDEAHSALAVVRAATDHLHRMQRRG